MSQTKKVLISAGSAAVLFASLIAPALASNSGDGSDYGTQPGYQQASDCGTYHGAFNAFGKNFNFAGGADGQATGAANSAKGCQNNF